MAGFPEHPGGGRHRLKKKRENLRTRFAHSGGGTKPARNPEGPALKTEKNGKKPLRRTRGDVVRPS